MKTYLQLIKTWLKVSSTKENPLYHVTKEVDENKRSILLKKIFSTIV